MHLSVFGVFNLHCENVINCRVYAGVQKMLNWLQVMENRLDSFGLVPAEIRAIEKQLSDLKVCKHSLLCRSHVISCNSKN